MEAPQPVQCTRKDAATRVVALVSIALLAVTLSPGAAWASAKAEPAPGTPEGMTYLLKNRTARIELNGGDVIAKAKKIEVGQCFVTWRHDGRPREVPVADVLSITALERDRGMRGLAIGSGIGIGLGAQAAGSADSGTVADPALGAEAFMISVLVAAPVGWGIGRLVKKPEQSIYSVDSPNQALKLPPCD